LKLSAWITFFYAITIIAGGTMGYIKAGSTISLVLGSVSGLFLLSTMIATWKGKMIGLYSAIFYAGILDAFFTYRLVKTQQFMPSGIMCILSLAFVGFITLQIRKLSRKSLEKT
jgi:uncharacterized membrane protein (UPF0136 family)